MGTPLDWAIIVGYLVLTLVLGLLLTRRAGASTKEFFVSGRSLPWWLAGTSMVATSLSCDTPLVVAAWTLSGGIAGNWLWWAFAVGGMFSVFLLSRLWRRAEVVTDVELTEMRYAGNPAALLRGLRAAYLAIPVNCITLAWVILAMKKILVVVFDWHPVLAVAVCAVVTLAYCTASGLWGVVVTDFFQFLIATAASIALAVVVVSRVGGLDGLAAAASQRSPLGADLLNFFPRPPAGVGFFSREFLSSAFFAFMVFVFVQWWSNKNADGGGDVVQRMSACRNERHSLLATLWFNIANYALRPWPWILVALAAVAAGHVDRTTNLEDVYPLMIRQYAPAGVLGIMIAYLLAAFMSTLDTKLNLSSAYIVNDVYRRFIRRDADERHYLFVSRVASIGFMAVGALLALVCTSISGLFTFLLAFSSGFGIVHILRWFWWRINAWSEISAILATAVLASVLKALSATLGINDQLILLLTVLGSALVWIPVTFLTPPTPREKLVDFYRRVRPYGAWGNIPAAAGLPPSPGLGRLLLNWMAGTVMVLSATLSVGKFLLGSPGEGALYLAAAVAGGVFVGVEIFRRDAVSPASPAGPNPS